MNRAERRRNERTKKEAVVNIKRNDIDKMKKDATDKAVSRAFVLMMNVPLLVLRDKYGFGAKRLGKFMEYMLLQFEAIQEGYVNFDEMKTALEEETGIKVEDN